MSANEANMCYDECVSGNFGSTLKTIAYRFSGIDRQNVMKQNNTPLSKENEEAVAKYRKMKEIFARTKCFDVFKNIQINDKSLYGEQSKERFIQYKSKLS